MPPRRSVRQKRPSSQALEAIVAAPPRQSRRSGSATQSSGVLPASGTAGNEAVIAGTTANNSVFPPELLDQLVARVTAEVTKQLQPAPTPQGQEGGVPPPPSGKAISQPGQLMEATEVPVVLDSVRSFQSSLAGEQGARPKEVFTSVNLPVDARVSAKIKTKILQEEFIDFGSLLVNPTLNDKFQITIQNANEGSSPSLALEPLNRAKRVTTIDTWLQAFHVFVGVYTGLHSQEAPGLMKYGATIQDLAARGHDWRYYDENFRFLRQSQASSLPWGNIHWELWLKSQNTPKKLPTSDGPRKSFSTLVPRVPRGYCFKFHRGGDCLGCAFKHSCFKCEGLHRALNCNFRPFNRNAGNTSQFRGVSKPPGSQSFPRATPSPVTNTRQH